MLSSVFKDNAPFLTAKSRSCAQFAPGANLHPGVFLAMCIFGHVNGVLRICNRVQIVHMNAKFLISIHFDQGF